MRYDIEDVERAAMEDENRAAAAHADRLGQASRPIGSAFASAFSALPDSAIVTNRSVGLGLYAPATRAEVDTLVDLYASAGIRRYFVTVHPDARPAALHDWLLQRGLEEARGWVKFSRGREAPPEAETDLTVRRARPEDAAAFGRIEAGAFDLGAPGAVLMAGLVGRIGWRVYMTFDGDEPAGCATLFVRDGVAWLDWGATAPAFRGRGSQSALLRQRILDAIDLGCDLLATTTGEEVPDDEQISYGNIVKMGFRPAYTCRNYAPPKRG